MLDQLGVHRSLLNHATVIIARFDRKRRGTPRFIDILIRLDVDHEAAMRREDGRGAGNLAIARVGDSGFDAIAHVRLLLFHRGGNRDGQFSIRVELAGLFEDLLAFAIVAFVVVALLVLHGVKRIPVVGFVDDILHAAARHGLAEEVARGDQRLYGRALQHAPLVRGDPHFVFRLLVLLDMESAADVAFAHVHLDGIVAERGVGLDRHVTLDRAHRRDLHVLAHGRLSLGVEDFHGGLLRAGQTVSRSGLIAQDALPVHGMAGAVDGAVGVDHARRIAVGIARQIPIAERIDGEIVAAAGEDERRLRIGVGELDVGEPVRIGADARNLLLAGPHQQ